MGRNPESNQQVKEARREQILSAGLRLFATKGLGGTRISDIAAAAGISQGLIYRYFAAKEDIFTELIRGAFEKMNAACHMLEGLPISPLDKVRMALEKLLEGLATREDTARYYLLIAQATVSDTIPAEAREVILRENQEPYEVMTRIFAEGQRTGAFRPDPPTMLAILFWTSINGLSIYKAVHADRFVCPTPDMLLRLFV